MNWKPLLNNISQTLLANDDLLDEYKNQNLEWLGFEGVSELEIQDHEARLENSLPPSYREFLKVSNGFKQLNCFIWNILPIEKIDWLDGLTVNFDNAWFNVRASNTEPVLRLNAEAKTIDELNVLVTKVTDLITAN